MKVLPHTNHPYTMYKLGVLAKKKTQKQEFIQEYFA